MLERDERFRVTYRHHYSWKQFAAYMARTRTQSRFLPDIDLDFLCTFTDRPTTTQAIRDYRAALRKRMK